MIEINGFHILNAIENVDNNLKWDVDARRYLVRSIYTQRGVVKDNAITFWCDQLNKILEDELDCIEEERVNELETGKFSVTLGILGVPFDRVLLNAFWWETRKNLEVLEPGKWQDEVLPKLLETKQAKTYPELFDKLCPEFVKYLTK